MFIDSAKNTLRIAARDDELTPDGTHYLLRMRRDSSLFYHQHRNAIPTHDKYAQAAEYLSEITELHISANQAEAMLSLYPHVRINLATTGSISSSDVRDGLSQAVAHFFLGCSWPTIGDEVDIDTFVELLKQSARLMNFESLV